MTKGFDGENLKAKLLQISVLPLYFINLKFISLSVLNDYCCICLIVSHINKTVGKYLLKTNNKETKTVFMEVFGCIYCLVL